MDLGVRASVARAITGVVDHVVGELDLLAQRHLVGDSGARRRRGRRRGPPRGPAGIEWRAGDDHYQTVHGLVATRLDQDRRVPEDEPGEALRASRSVKRAAKLSRMAGWVDGLQPTAPLGSVNADSRPGACDPGAVRLQHTGAELLDDRRQRGLPRLHDLTGQPVRIDDHAARPRRLSDTRALAGRDPAGETDPAGSGGSRVRPVEPGFQIDGRSGRRAAAQLP